MEINNNPSFGKKRIEVKKNEQKSFAPAQNEMSNEKGFLHANRKENVFK